MLKITEVFTYYINIIVKSVMKWEYRILLQSSKGEIQGSFIKKVVISVEPK